MRIEILDLKQNNLSSVEKALVSNMEKTDTCVSIGSPSESIAPNLLILPGLGHFASGMEQLRTSGFDELLTNRNLEEVPIVGICLGMQLLCQESEEAPGIPGLGIIPGAVKKLPQGEPRPNIGWCEVDPTFQAQDFPSLTANRDYYFVHSYFVSLDDDDLAMTTTKFADTKFTSSFRMGSVLGFQFHPEKSGEIGQNLIRDILGWAR